MSAGDKPLKMVTCPGCDAKVFIPGDLPPLAIEPCKRCGHAIMMPMQLRQFELRSKIASGGHGKVYRAFGPRGMPILDHRTRILSLSQEK